MIRDRLEFTQLHRVFDPLTGTELATGIVVPARVYATGVTRRARFCRKLRVEVHGVDDRVVGFATQM